MRRRAALLAGLLAGRPGGAARAAGRTVLVRLGDSLRDAVARAHDGDTVELEAGTHRAQTAVVTQRQLVLRGVGGRAVLQADGAQVEGKALVVVRGGQVRIEQVEFRGARVPDGNGAGIRFERGALTLRHCAFFDNEMGLLSSNADDGELVIEDCEFGQAPHHDGLLHHLLYVGRLRSLRLSGCRFTGGWRGHLVKSRAARNMILCNQLVDGEDGQASYEVDLPNGGVAWVVGNVMVQGPRAQNLTLLAYGAEGMLHADSALYVAHNSFVNLAEAPAPFVRLWPERLPAGLAPGLHNNLAFGAAVDGSWGARSDGNVWRELADLDTTMLPRVQPKAGARDLPNVDAATVARGVALAPAWQIALPYGMQPLATPARWRPGAFQN